MKNPQHDKIFRHNLVLPRIQSETYPFNFYHAFFYLRYFSRDYATVRDSIATRNIIQLPYVLYYVLQTSLPDSLSAKDFQFLSFKGCNT